jgi:SAM-dependent methyltransferase
MVEARESQWEPVLGRAPEGDYWQHRAAHLHREFARAQDRAMTDPFLALVRSHAGPQTGVLDVGAGTGRHTLRLARFVRSVRAVEPSAAMREILLRDIAASGLTNIDVLPHAWPAAGVEPADVVICAHVLYRVADIGPFVRALDEAARQACFILLRTDGNPLTDGYWQQVYGLERCPEAGLPDAYNVCLQLGLRPHVTMLPASHTAAWDSPDEALQDIAARLFLTEDSPQYSQLRTLLGRDLRSTPAGWRVDVAASRQGVIWWEKPLQ